MKHFFNILKTTTAFVRVETLQIADREVVKSLFKTEKFSLSESFAKVSFRSKPLLKQEAHL